MCVNMTNAVALACRLTAMPPRAGKLEWAAFGARFAVPKPLRDWFYSDVVSANRIKWFGASDQCRFMDDEHERRFLS